MVLYPVMASHRDISPKQRERMGIRENLVRLSIGIEAVDDILSDLERALQA
jgi:cystathionine beta-lyase/cystathionine gamma-synthase